MSNVVNLTEARFAKRDRELRQRFNVEEDETALPIGYLVARLIERTRVRMASERATVKPQ